MTMNTPSLPQFQPLGPNIALYTPQSKPTALIILCTWLGGATPRRLTKYTSGYTENFPDAAILLVKTTLPDILIQNNSAISKRLAPAREVISGFLRTNSGEAGNGNGTRHGRTPRPPAVLLHIFSHGGSNIATQLLRSIAATDPLAHEMLLSALNLVILDCCPGDSTFKRNYNAVAVSLPPATNQPLSHYIGRMALYPVVGTIMALMATGFMRSIEDLRTELNDPLLLGRSARRVVSLFPPG
ncbi:uncharacterized protein DSM5745_10666 [Aspergillus mulundensis]|uniref:Uncharacterized protein n=1 Tax=Aspergillus mulundensis TaxID=1810919 RepID=A0A3D8QHJ3_9EURO|nr:Uncharacterized protein DSM5745_10666 [Aspergillus mulundensis]RDW61168.1 Uncharacterized protein DSM5745_10666 [Aspergillus mulundensis]